jgi:hypothetical protein
MRPAPALAFYAFLFQESAPRLPPPSGSNDPRLQDTWLARLRTDGTYEPLLARPILRSASAPEGLVLREDGAAGKAGDILVLLVDGLTLEGPGSAGLSLVRSSDGGKTWTARRPILVRGKRNRGACLDPSLVLLPDGEIRMFFFASEIGTPLPGEREPRDPASASPHEIHSAVSTDWEIFWVEEGVRVAVPLVTDPAVVRVSEREWWMFLSRGPETLLARSEDGLSFALDPDWICREGGAPGARSDRTGGARLLVSGRDGILEMPVRPDRAIGLSRLVLPTPRDGVVAAPSAVRLQDGSELLVYEQIQRPERPAPDFGAGLRRLPEVREKVRKELEEWAASRPTDDEGNRLVRARFIVGEAREVRDEGLLVEFPQCRFFELSFGSHEEGERPGETPIGPLRIGDGRRAYGILEGSGEVSEVTEPAQMGEFLRKGRIRIQSAESLGALLDRCCIGWFGPPEPGAKARVVAESSGFLVEGGERRWRFRTDSEGRVLGVDSLP